MITGTILARIVQACITTALQPCAAAIIVGTKTSVERTRKIILENKLPSRQNRRGKKKKSLLFPRVLHFLLGHSPCKSNEPRSLELASSTMMKLSLAKSVLSKNSPWQQTTMRRGDTATVGLSRVSFILPKERCACFTRRRREKGGDRADYPKRARDVAQSQDLLSKLTDS